MTGVLGALAGALLAFVLLALFMLLAFHFAWPRMRAALRRLLTDIAGPAIVSSLPPRDALEAALAPLYGADFGDVLIGLLGGPGRELSGRDTAISRRASAHFRLESIDDNVCRAEATWTYEFSGRRDNHTLVIFGTHDSEMARIVTQERALPIYELWKLNNEDELEDFVDNVRSTIELGITYLDGQGVSHTVAPRRQPGEEVAWADYQKFVRITDKANRADLRMVTFDLHDLADPDHVVQSVESLTLRACNDAANLGFFTWSAPFPCYVQNVELDVTDLPREDEQLEYTIVASSPGWYRLPVKSPWRSIHGKLTFPFDSWMMAGHGVTLLWRPDRESEPQAGRPGR